MLAHHGLAFTARDLFARPLGEDEIRALAGLASADALFSWRSPTARRQGLTPGSLDTEAMLRRMAAEPRLIRRPLIVSADTVIIGADAAVIATLASAEPP